MELVAWISLGVAFACACWIAVDEMRNPQPMSVMNVVWPVTALYFSVFAVWAYIKTGRPKGLEAEKAESRMNMRHVDSDPAAPPTFAQVAVGASHCGTGCMIADVFCEFGVAALGFSFLGSILWAEFAIDFIAAWVLGILFQYFAIKPMGNLTAGQAILAAVKADTLSILAFQIGMYGWMACVFFRLFPGPHLNPFEASYWLMMQSP